MRRKLGVLIAGLVLTLSSLVALAAPASAKVVSDSSAATVSALDSTKGTTSVVQAAGVVPNLYECHPKTGWCYQTNPPYNPAYARSCRWNYTIPWLTSGMWYTGCTAGWWRPEVH